MKKVFQSVVIIAITALSFAACNNGGVKSEATTTAATTKPVAEPAVATAAAASPSNILQGYLTVKNALTTDDTKTAATAATALVATIKDFGKTAMTAEQKKAFTDIEEDAAEHAEHIGTNGGNLEHQREHFDMLSKDMLAVVKTFGAGQTMYKDFCPMYNDSKGAFWLSETKDIKNPYYGKKMLTCGSMKEELK